MKRSVFTLDHVRRLQPDLYEMEFFGDASAITAPGQFVNIELPGKFLRRPISVCDWDDGRLLLLVKEAGDGTRALVRSPVGARFDVLTGLGNGFDLARAGEDPVLVGGGIGAAPLYGLARRMAAAGQAPAVALGFRSAGDAIYIREFSQLGCRVLVATEDGSRGSRGFVTDLLADRTCYVYACGPTPMLKAVHGLPGVTGGQFSFEARMACGFGACVGCSIPTSSGMRRVCKDGPVFQKEEIVW